MNAKHQTTEDQTQQEYVGPNHFFIDDLKLYKDTDFLYGVVINSRDEPPKKQKTLFQK